MLQKFLIEFIVNTSFLLLPILVKITLYGFSVFSDWLNIFLVILIIFQTYILAKYDKLKKIHIFLLNIFFIFVYFVVRWIFNWFEFLQESIYIFFMWFVLVNALFRTFLYDNKLLLTAFYNFFKIEILPVFYYFVLVSEWNLNIWMFEFFNKFENRVLLFIFTFFAIFYSILIYYLLKKEKYIEWLHNLLKEKLKYTINWEELLKNFEEWKLEFDTELIEKVVIFMDIRWFTTWSEENKNNSGEVVKLLNNFYEIWDKYLEKYNWKIDKFIWDAIMYTFDDLENAIKFAQNTIKEEQNFLSKYWLKVWIGINKWKVIKWWIWSKNKKEETVIWDVVNTASRLEWWENEIRIFKKILPDWYKVKEIWKIQLKWKEKEEEIVSIYY